MSCCQICGTNIHTIDPNGPWLAERPPGIEHLGVLEAVSMALVTVSCSGQFGLGHGLDLKNLVPLLSGISSDIHVSNILCGCYYAVYIINNDKESKDENVNISNNIYYIFST